MSSSRLTSRKRAEAAPGGVAQLTSRKRAKAAPGGVGSALELEHRCGRRLRQVRSAEMALGVFDVMRLDSVEFHLEVSREVARQWLEICGAACPSHVLLRIESADELERRCGPFLRANGFEYGIKNTSDAELVEAFRGFFPHVMALADVLRSWARVQAGTDSAILDLARFKRLYKNRSHAPRVRLYEDLVSKCGPLLDYIFEAAPRVSKRKLASAMCECHLDIDFESPPVFLEDYVALRRAGLRFGELLLEVPPEQIAACMADLHLHDEGPAGAQLCAARRGVAISWRSLANFQTCSGKARHVGMVEVGLDSELREELRRLLAEHLVPRGVHRVCEEFLARKRVVLSFRRLRARLLRRPFEDFGRLPAEGCWRVMFAYVERGRNYLAYGPYSE